MQTAIAIVFETMLCSSGSRNGARRVNSPYFGCAVHKQRALSSAADLGGGWVNSSLLYGFGALGWVLLSFCPFPSSSFTEFSSRRNKGTWTMVASLTLCALGPCKAVAPGRPCHENSCMTQPKKKCWIIISLPFTILLSTSRKTRQEKVKFIVCRIRSLASLFWKYLSIWSIALISVTPLTP